MTKSVIFAAALAFAAPALAATPAGTTLAAIINPPMQIGTANVLDSRGRIVGAVQRVEVTPDGHPTQVAVAMLGNPDQLVVLDARNVRYDADTNQIIAQAGIAPN